METRAGKHRLSPPPTQTGSRRRGPHHRGRDGDDDEEWEPTSDEDESAEGEGEESEPPSLRAAAPSKRRRGTGRRKNCGRWKQLKRPSRALRTKEGERRAAAIAARTAAAPAPAAGVGFNAALFEESAADYLELLAAEGEAAGATAPQFSRTMVMAAGMVVRPCFSGGGRTGQREATVERAAAATAAAAEAPVRRAEGLRLHPSSGETGYRGVVAERDRHRKPTGRFEARHKVAGRQVSLGRFDTAVEAAVAHARAVGEYQPPAQPPPTVAAEAEGLRLHLSSSSGTGYKGVHHNVGRFKARHGNRRSGGRAHLGYFDTAVEAAVAYARAVGVAQGSGLAPAAAGSSVTRGISSTKPVRGCTAATMARVRASLREMA